MAPDGSTMPGKFAGLLTNINRRTHVRHRILNTQFKRVLTLYDLIGLGLSGTVGTGVYLTLSRVAQENAGPSVVLCYILAGVVSLFSSLCFMELGATVHKTGSAYIYTYAVVGEGVAFATGWVMILESLYGTAGIARSMSVFIDSATGYKMSAFFESVIPITSSYFVEYFDLFSFCLVLIVGGASLLKVRTTIIINNVFILMNLTTIVLIIVLGAIKVNPENWKIPSSEIPPGFGKGGFFAYNLNGMLEGAAICFYAYSGFDTVNFSAEEVQDAHRKIPLSIIITMCSSIMIYVALSIILTLMLPYYDQVTESAILVTFQVYYPSFVIIILAVGAVSGILANLNGMFFPLPRLLYAMSNDGLLCKVFSVVIRKGGTATWSTVLPMCISAVLAAIMRIRELVKIMSCGNLLSYSLANICIIVLRYKSTHTPEKKPEGIKQLFSNGTRPNVHTYKIVYICLILYVIVCIVWSIFYNNGIFYGAAALNAAMLVLIIIMSLQPSVSERLLPEYKTPLVPLIPCLGLFFNIQMLAMLGPRTWIQCFVWLLIGVPVYLYSYGYGHKKYDLHHIIDEFNSNIRRSEDPEDKKNNNSLVIKDENNLSKGVDSLSMLKKKSEKPSDDSEKVNLEKPDDSQIVKNARQQTPMENNEEPEAKIIDLLDQVIQAEEDNYRDAVSLNEIRLPSEAINAIPRQSFSTLSDAGSDTSSNNILSKYEVVVQVHREDMPTLDEEPTLNLELIENETNREKVIFYNDSETSSRTDESGYSDTTDNNTLMELVEPVEDLPKIPTPPPFDEKLFLAPAFKSFTISAKKKPSNLRSEIEEPRRSIQSNGSTDENLVFGSTRQLSFMSKLNTILINKPTAPQTPIIESRQRSNSTGNLADLPKSIERPKLFLDLKQELLLNHKLRHIDKDENVNEEELDTSMTKDILKSKLENIYAGGGPKIVKLKKISTLPEDNRLDNQDEETNVNSKQILPKVEKNDTLKRQKDKFGAVLNSLRISLDQSDAV